MQGNDERKSYGKNNQIQISSFVKDATIETNYVDKLVKPQSNIIEKSEFTIDVYPTN